MGCWCVMVTVRVSNCNGRGGDCANRRTSFLRREAATLSGDQSRPTGPQPTLQALCSPTCLRRRRQLGCSSGAVPASNVFSRTHSPCTRRNKSSAAVNSQLCDPGRTLSLSQPQLFPINEPSLCAPRPGATKAGLGLWPWERARGPVWRTDSSSRPNSTTSKFCDLG